MSAPADGRDHVPCDSRSDFQRLVHVRKRPFPHTRSDGSRRWEKPQLFVCETRVEKLFAISYSSASFQRTRRLNMLIGYARVSTADQNLDLQRDALTAAGCERIFEDTSSGVRDDRPGLAEALSHVRHGDCLVIWRLDRLGRLMTALLSFVEELRQRGCDFRILSGSCLIDTTTASGRLLFHISAALAENERDVIRERTIAGLASARARGRKGGRPPKLTAKQVHTARKMLADPEMTIKEVAEVFGVNRATIYRSLGLGVYAKLQGEAVRTDR